MDQFLNDASGLVQDSGDNQRGGMRQQPGSEIMGRTPPASIAKQGDDQRSVSSFGSSGPSETGISARGSSDISNASTMRIGAQRSSGFSKSTARPNLYVSAQKLLKEGMSIDQTPAVSSELPVGHNKEDDFSDVDSV